MLLILTLPLCKLCWELFFTVMSSDKNKLSLYYQSSANLTTHNYAEDSLHSCTLCHHVISKECFQQCSIPLDNTQLCTCHLTQQQSLEQDAECCLHPWWRNQSAVRLLLCNAWKCSLGENNPQNSELTGRHRLWPDGKTKSCRETRESRERNQVSWQKHWP
jgi:hypothetical protein